MAMSTVTKDDTPDPPGRKATLICQRCGHENPVDGDWIVAVRRESLSLECPDCDHDVTTRPRPNAA